MIVTNSEWFDHFYLNRDDFPDFIFSVRKIAGNKSQEKYEDLPDPMDECPIFTIQADMIQPANIFAFDYRPLLEINRRAGIQRRYGQNDFFRKIELFQPDFPFRSRIEIIRWEFPVDD